MDYESVAALNPRVVYCSISGFGDDAGADRPGDDFLVQALGGLMSITGDTDGEPRKVGVALVDVLTGKDAVIGILAALTARQRTGRGEHVQVDLLSSLLAGLTNQAASFLATGVAPSRMGNRHPSIAPYETLHCADGILAIACGNDSQFARLANALGHPELAEDQRFADNPARVAHREQLVAALEDALHNASAREWERRLAAAGVPAGPVGSISGGIALAETLGLNPLLDLGTGHAPQIRHAARYSVSAPAPTALPPRLGQHTELVRTWLHQPAHASALPHPSDAPSPGCPKRAGSDGPVPVPAELRDRLQSRAERAHTTVSELAREAIERYLAS